MTTLEEAEARARAHRPAAGHPARLHAGRHRRRHRPHARSSTSASSRAASRPARSRQVLVERSLLGWKEIEYEVMRDGADNCITICNMENFDPMGVHTGDSIVVAPSQTLTRQGVPDAPLGGAEDHPRAGHRRRLQHPVRPGAAARRRAVGLAGRHRSARRATASSCRRTTSSRSTRASRAAPPSRARRPATRSRASRPRSPSARRWTRSPTPSRRRTTAAFEPALDYCVVKIPRWPFDKFPFGDRQIGTQMKATGEVMAIDRSFEAALQKAVRSLEIGGRSLLWEDPNWADDPIARPLDATDERLWAVMAALRRGADDDGRGAPHRHRPVVPRPAAEHHRAWRSACWPSR